MKLLLLFYLFIIIFTRKDLEPDAKMIIKIKVLLLYIIIVST